MSGAEAAKSFTGKRVCLLGYGREGQSSHRFLKRFARDVRVSIADAAAECRPLFETERLICGEDYLSSLSEFDVIIKSPGVPLRLLPELPPHVRLTSQTEIFLEHFVGFTVGITGTYGKSTTTSLIFELLKTGRRPVHLTGNIGIPPLDVLAVASPDSIAVFEMSSHQLQHGAVSPDLAIALNIFPEHLDYYQTFESYRRAKQNIAAGPRCKVFLYNAALPELRTWAHARAEVRTFAAGQLEADYTVSADQFFVCGRPALSLSPDRALRGAHNDSNLAAALAAAAELDLEREALAKAAAAFKPLPHRIEFVAEVEGRKFYDDSASTAPEATLAAIRALAPIDVLIVGGLDRAIPLEDFADALADAPVRTLIGLPDTGTQVLEIIRRKSTCALNLINTTSLEQAVHEAFGRTRNGAVCLFSPGAASYNAFNNFVERGKAFCSLVERLKDRTG